MTAVTFIIPVRHQDNAADWPKLKANLAQTLASIAGQSDSSWRCLIVANEGADLPPLPAQVEVVWVHFPPNQQHDIKSLPRDQVLDAFRFDKGRRVLSGMLAAKDSDYFMIVDDDDFVSRQIVAHARANAGSRGWSINRGYVWNDGGEILLEHNDFNHICGTSLIVRSDLYQLPDRFEDATEDFIKEMLGSHYAVAERLAVANTPLAPLPFRGAVYRVANPGSHSQTPDLMRRYVVTRSNIRRPWRLALALCRLRPRTRRLNQEFFGT